MQSRGGDTLSYACGICGREGDEIPRVLQCGVCSVLLCHKHYLFGACEKHFNDLDPADREALKTLHERSSKANGGAGDFIILSASILVVIASAFVCASLAPVLVPEPLFWLVTSIIVTSAVIGMVWGMYWQITRFKRRRERMQENYAAIETILLRYRLSPRRAS
jgi:hypothetical protein